MKVTLIGVLAIVTITGLLTSVYNLGWVGGYVQGMVDCRTWVKEAQR